MKASIILALCSLVPLPPLVAPTGQQGQAAAASSTEHELLAVAEAWRTSYNAKDAVAVASLYAPNGYYVSAHVVARGRSEIQAYFQRGIDAGGHIDSIELLSTGRSGDLAYWVGTYEATNAGQKVRGRNVVVVRRVGKTWLMVAHESAVADQP
jgi:ketosteroid isomerase-like protein